MGLGRIYNEINKDQNRQKLKKYHDTKFLKCLSDDEPLQASILYNRPHRLSHLDSLKRS